VQLIRGRVVAGAIALFVAVFAGITAQLASGHDPALSTSSTTTAKATTQQQGTQQQQQSSQQQSNSLSPVTTSQS
jgi:hypothetical protein